MKTIWLYAAQEEGMMWLSPLRKALPQGAFGLQFVAAEPAHLALQRTLQTAVSSPHLILFLGEVKEPILAQVSQLCRSANIPVL